MARSKVFNKARQQADERGQDVSIMDLVDAFPRDDARDQIVYGSQELDSVPAMIERIEKSLAPRLNDFLARLESQVREMTQRNVELVLQDFANKVRDRLDAMAPPVADTTTRQPELPDSPPPQTSGGSKPFWGFRVGG